MFRRVASALAGATKRDRPLWRVEDYRGQRAVAVAATQLGDRLELTRTQRRKILDDWITFLSTTDTHIESLEFVSRVPQELLDAVAGQAQLRALAVKWGPYEDLSALSGLSSLSKVSFGGASRVESLEPLRSLPCLTDLRFSEAFRVQDVSLLGELVTLRSLTFGSDYPGTDRSVTIGDVGWVRGLTELRVLALPGTRILDPDLSPILDLPHLEELRLPLRRSYRKQVFALASASSAFAGLASNYEAYESSAALTRKR